MKILGGAAQIPHSFLRLSQSVQFFSVCKLKMQRSMIKFAGKLLVRLFDQTLDTIRSLHLFYSCIFIDYRAIAVKLLKRPALLICFRKQYAAIRLAETYRAAPAVYIYTERFRIQANLILCLFVVPHPFKTAGILSLICKSHL